MFSRIYVAAAAIVMAFGASSPAAAAIIYDNGGPDLATGHSDVATGNEVTKWVEAEDFSVASSTTLAGAHFWTLENSSSWDGTLTWYVFANVGGLPGSAPLETGSGVNVARTATGNEHFGEIEYAYSFDLDTPVALVGGTDYWFALHLSSDFDSDGIFWETTSSGLGANGAQSEGGTFVNWIGNGRQHAFNLTNETTAVPEPSTLVMLGAGLSSLAALGRRRKARA